MAENNNDIWSALNQTYIKSASVERKEQQDTITNGYKTIYKNDLDIIQRFADKQKSVFKEIADEEAKLHQLSLQYKRDIFKQESQHYDNIYNLKTGMYKREVSFLERERDIREKIAKDGKTTLGDLAELYTLEREREKERKKSIEAQQEQFKKRVENVKKGISTIFEHIFKLLNSIDDLNVWNNWSKGLKDLGSAYEERFTEIAARNGSDTQMETHSMIKNALTTVMNDSILVKGLNFNTEVFPAITEAVQKGFMGQEATDIAINNAIDKKITPWLDTSSETWVNLQYQLSDDMLAQLKGQQMLLQETREGNRILQNGVVTALMDELAPTLLNIDANTTNVTDLSGQAQQMVASLMANGYSKQDAVKVANQTIDAYQNPFQNLSGNSSTWQKLLAIGGLNGGDLASAMDFATGAISPFNNGTWQAGGAVAANLGVPTNGFTRNTNYIEDLIGAADAALKYSGGNLSGTYNNAVTNLNEFTTATQQNDNKYQNGIAEISFDMNLIRHGIEIESLILDEVHQLKTSLFTTAGVLIGGIIADKLTDGFIKKFLTKFKGGGASSSGGNILSNIGGKLGSGLMPGAGGVPGAGKLGFMSSGTGAILGSTAGVAAGALIAKEGFEGIHEANQVINDKSSLNSEIESAKFSKGASGVAAGAGIAGAGAILALGASNPVGWVALAIGGLALGAKAINDHVNRLSGLSEQYEAHGEELKSAFQKEQQSRIEESAFLKQNILSAKTDKEAQNEIINSGLLSEKTARDLTSKELSTLTTEIIKTESAITALGDAAIDAKTKVAKEEAQQQAKDVLDDTYNNIKSLLGSDNVVKKGDTEYAQIKAMFEGMASSITNDEERKLMEEQLKTMFADEEFDLSELKVLMNKGGNARSFWHTTIDRKRNFYDYAMDVESANAYLGIIDGNGAYDLRDVTIDQDTAAWQASMDEWYKTYNNSSDTATKEAAKNKFLDIWNTNIKPNTDYYEYLQPKYKSKAEAMGITGFRLGSSYIPIDMIAMLHAGERVLTEGQNKQYTEELVSGNSTSSIIQAGVQDIVIAIKSQTSEIINYLSTMSFSNSSFGNSQLNMLPSMGNTKVTI